MTNSEQSPQTCQLCEPAPHPNCEAYTQLVISDPRDDRGAPIWVCLGHYEAIEEVLKQHGGQ